MIHEHVEIKAGIREMIFICWKTKSTCMFKVKICFVLFISTITTSTIGRYIVTGSDFSIPQKSIITGEKIFNISILLNESPDAEYNAYRVNMCCVYI